MALELIDSTIKKLPTPASGNKVYYDAKTPGFGIRITAADARAFVLNYRTRTGRERRYTIGAFPGWTTKRARAKAEKLKERIRDGHDPLAEIEADRDAPTVADLAARFAEQHLDKLRPSTRRNYRAMLDDEILPALRHLKVEDVTRPDIDGLHYKITRRAPYVANRVLQLCTRLFNLAIQWGWCERNPCAGVEHNREEKRHRYLSAQELERLTAALAAHHDQQAADVIRLLLLTGARKGEVLSMRWADLDLTAGTWTKAASTTKQKAFHHVPLSAPARQLLARRLAGAEPDAMFVFPAPPVARPSRSGHRAGLENDWDSICNATGIAGARVHDLRHTYASQLVNLGIPLEVIGKLLGHSQISTTQRYAHLRVDVLAQATERVGALIQNIGKPATEPTPLGRARR
jgi:integrase